MSVFAPVPTASTCGSGAVQLRLSADSEASPSRVSRETGFATRLPARTHTGTGITLPGAAAIACKTSLIFFAVLALFAAACSSSNGGSGANPAGGNEPNPSGTGTPSDSRPPVASAQVKVAFARVLDGFKRPVFVTAAFAGDTRLFVVEKGGTIRIVENGAILADPFLDVRKLVITQGNEQGLLGLAFHPDYKTNGRFFIAYTANSAGAGDNSLAEYRVSSSNPNKADAASGKVLLAIPDFAANHNGGMVAFGPDGYLYMSTGDGGAQGDTKANGQNKNALLAKILRLDVDTVPAGKTYGIPSTNPFAGGGGAPEAWAYGLRNPWRFSFDRATGDLYIGDVGQDKWEEIDVQLASSKGGENYGWNTVEGPECYSPANCDKSASVAPVASYAHAQGCSVTGGYVYRGTKYPALVGTYLYADYCSGNVWTMTRDTAGKYTSTIAVEDIKSITSFGEDGAGELYAVDDTGSLLRVTAAAAAVPSSSGTTAKLTLTVESPEIATGKSIPARFTCDGANTSPQLSWDPTPPRTRSFVVILEDPDASGGTYSHWVLFNIPTVATFLGEGISAGGQLGAGPIQQGKNAAGSVAYTGPCPPSGKEHNYRFRVYALDISLSLKGGATREEVLKAVEGHVLAEGELAAKYKRQ